MRRIIIAAILTVICAVGAGTSFAVNDLPNFGEWMKTNEQQFRKPHKHDGPNKHMDKHMMDGKGQQAPQDGQGSNPGQNMPPNGQVPPQNQNGQMAPQGQNGQVVPQNQMPPQGQPPQGQPPQGQPPQGGQPNGNAPQQAPNSETQAQ